MLLYLSVCLSAYGNHNPLVSVSCAFYNTRISLFSIASRLLCSFLLDYQSVVVDRSWIAITITIRQLQTMSVQLIAAESQEPTRDTWLEGRRRSWSRRLGSTRDGNTKRNFPAVVAVVKGSSSVMKCLTDVLLTSFPSSPQCSN